MFKSARLKLTLFYLTAIVGVTLISTLGTRYLAQVAFEDNDVNSRIGLRSLLRQEVGLPLPNNQIQQFQNNQENAIEDHLNSYVIYINVLALVIGGLSSYWFAGRTLKPIEDAHEAKARFASDASHELRTPLAVMKTENEVFLRQPDFSKGEARAQIVSNLEEIDRLEKLSTNLLELTNYEQGEKLEIKKIDSREIANLVIDNIKKNHPHYFKNVELDVKKHSIYGNRESIAQALTIFLDNAIKYSPEKKKIKLSGFKEDNSYKFVVEDNGPGIEQEDMPYIFDRLYRSDKNRATTIKGYGLGLSLAKEIAKANNAGLSVANQEGGGAQFTLSLPIE